MTATTLPALPFSVTDLHRAGAGADQIIDDARAAL
jgi:hypothetical protein